MDIQCPSNMEMVTLGHLGIEYDVNDYGNAAAA